MQSDRGAGGASLPCEQMIWRDDCGGWGGGSSQAAGIDGGTVGLFVVTP